MSKSFALPSSAMLANSTLSALAEMPKWDAPCDNHKVDHIVIMMYDPLVVPICTWKMVQEELFYRRAIQKMLWSVVHQYLYGLLDGGCTTWHLVVPPGTTHKVSKLAVAQAMSNPSKVFYTAMTSKQDKFRKSRKSDKSKY
ncbi:hypothetical protein EDB83DRAFT_2323436 [Lactarius deliciosus]|nr:hypothetical protein EDB83DRAFT_2323436 [Lactarius deliciosus]